MTDSEYKEEGDLNNLRERRGDFIDGKSTVTEDELDEKLATAQRTMLTYERLMERHNASPEKIVNGLEAIAMGKTFEARVEALEKENAELKSQLERQDSNTAKAVGADG